MTLYHEAPLNSLSELRHNGLKRTARGDKGDDPVIKRTDDYLDAHCPDKLRSYGVSRSNNLYAFLGDEAHIVDIQNGATLPLQDYPISDSILFRLSVDPASCFVSDLDRYDAVKAAVASHDTPNLPDLARRYWDAITSLTTYTPGTIMRPEVMITTDLAPAQLTQVIP